MLERGALDDDKLEEIVCDLHALGQVEVSENGDVLWNVNKRLDGEVVG